MKEAFRVFSPDNDFGIWGLVILEEPLVKNRAWAFAEKGMADGEPPAERPNRRPAGREAENVDFGDTDRVPPNVDYKASDLQQQLTLNQPLFLHLENQVKQ